MPSSGPTSEAADSICARRIGLRAMISPGLSDRESTQDSGRAWRVGSVPKASQARIESDDHTHDWLLLFGWPGAFIIRRPAGAVTDEVRDVSAAAGACYGAYAPAEGSTVKRLHFLVLVMLLMAGAGAGLLW